MGIRSRVMMVLLFLASVSIADQEASNVPVVRASEYGRMYAKSIPFENYGQEGITYIYQVTEDEDILVSQYDWYANEIYLGGSGGSTIIRLGPWHRGAAPEEDHLAIGIYRSGEVIAEYSTLELFESGSGLSVSVSHYQVLSQRLGFRWIESNDYVFEVESVNGSIFTFDLQSGTIVE